MHPASLIHRRQECMPHWISCVSCLCMAYQEPPSASTPVSGGRIGTATVMKAVAAAAVVEGYASGSHDSDSDTDSCSDMPPLIPITKRTVQCCSCFEREAVVHRLDCGHFMCCRECEVIIQGWGASTDATECFVCSESGGSG